MAVQGEVRKAIDCILYKASACLLKCRPKSAPLGSIGAAVESLLNVYNAIRRL